MPRFNFVESSVTRKSQKIVFCFFPRLYHDLRQPWLNFAAENNQSKGETLMVVTNRVAFTCGI